MLRLTRWLFAAVLATVPLTAAASFHLFQIEQIYSNADGTVQFVVLHEFAGANGENFLAGMPFSVTHAGVTKGITFPGNLPSGQTAGKRVLIATPGFAALGIATPDYMIPNQFLPIDGGTLNYAGVDQVSFAALPTDGVNAYFRNGTVGPNQATNFAGTSAAAPAGAVTIVEYYNNTLDHYFISALQPDIDALDSGRIPGWVRTGLGFKVFPSQASGGAGVNPVCRFYIPPEHGNSHFFSASPAECDAINGRRGRRSELQRLRLRDAERVLRRPCRTPPPVPVPANTVPVYRLWNQRADSNHRYTSSADDQGTDARRRIHAGRLRPGRGDHVRGDVMPARRNARQVAVGHDDRASAIVVGQLSA